MVKSIFGLFLISTFMLAGVRTANVTPEIVESGITIIDIRTKEEWIQTGILKDSIPITFFDAHGKYDALKFLDDINVYVKKGKEFAIICRTGNRTTAVSDFLGKRGYTVINLKGGIKRLMQQGYKLSKYTKDK